MEPRVVRNVSFQSPNSKAYFILVDIFVESDLDLKLAHIVSMSDKPGRNKVVYRNAIWRKDSIWDLNYCLKKKKNSSYEQAKYSAIDLRFQILQINIHIWYTYVLNRKQTCETLFLLSITQRIDLAVTSIKFVWVFFDYIRWASHFFSKSSRW